MYVSVSAFVHKDKVEFRRAEGGTGLFDKLDVDERELTREEWEIEKKKIEELLGTRKWYVDTNGPRFIYMSIFGSTKEK